MSSLKCCVVNCATQKGDGIPMHYFPNPKKYLDLFKTWLIQIGGEIVGLENEYIYQNRRVCSRHFEDKYFINKQKIRVKCAVPTLFVRDVHRSNMVKELSNQILPQTEKPKYSTNPQAGSLPGLGASSQDQLSTSKAGSPSKAGSTSAAVVDNVAITSTNQPKAVSPSNAGSTSAAVVDNVVVTWTYQPKAGSPSNAGSTSAAVVDNVITSTNRRVFYTAAERELRRELLTLTKKFDRSRTQIQVYKKRLQAAKSLSKNKKVINVLENVTPAAKLLFKMQMREAKRFKGKRKHGRRFLIKEKLLALSLYKQGPKVYDLLAKLLVLPSKSSLDKMLSNIDIKPGYNKNIFDQLKTMVDKMKKEHRICSVIFDEMSISTNLQYNPTDDNIVGFNTIKDGSKTFADHVLIFMVVGIVKKFKQPVWFTFTDQSVKAIDIKNTLKSVIKAVMSTGLEVVCTICDQAQTFRTMINSLVEDTSAEYKRKNIELRDDFFEINNKVIIPLFDPPHLLKGMRNNLINKHLYAIIDNKQVIAKWDHIRMAYDKNPHFRGLSVLFKVTELHVEPEKIKKMKVKYAAQVFSASVGASIGYMADNKMILEECADTAEILIFFDKLFDSVNASYSGVRNGKLYRVALTPTSIHHKFWQEALAILRSMKFEFTKINKKTGEPYKKLGTVPSIASWIKTIEGLIFLSKRLREHYNCYSILTRHLNQDPLENLFAWLRSYGIWNINPTAANFIAYFRSCLINKYANRHSVAANCEKDTFKCLKTMHTLLSNSSKRNKESSEPIPIDEDHLILDPDGESGILEQAVLEYVSGYIGRACKKIFKNCNEALYDSSSSESAYIRKREYQAGKTFLKYPSQSFLKCFSHVNFITFYILKDKAQMSDISTYIKTVISVNVDFSFINCDEHKVSLQKFIVDIGVKFFINRYCKIINELLNGKRLQFDENDTIQKTAHDYYQNKRKTKEKK